MDFIGRNIKQFRSRIAMTQDELSQLLGVKRELISYFENGKRTPSLIHLNEIADILGVDLDALLNEDESSAEADVVLAFRSDELDLNQIGEIASFKKIIRNYLKMDSLVKKNEL